ncbi:Ankyrin repeat domain-containing protein 50 [Geodia barretti]|uniref:Ankyrin repeat domain-containing protein 50 n=1 Tax=Geodia barretti TaxID=519541 RepID=A0AA35T6E0_GEOBA|nr:Ankyrin repeat domain-containing protein 50 [Geodia barretti]
MSNQLTIHDFARVQEALWAARSKWDNIGTRLKLDVRELECIETEGGMSLDKKFNLMIQTRLKKIEPCTWRDLYDALNHPTVAMSDVACKLVPYIPPVAAPTETGYTDGVAPAASVTTSPIVTGPQIDSKEFEKTSEMIDQLQKEYIDISFCAAEELSANVAVKKLRFSLLSLPPNLKKNSLSKAKAEIKEAKSTDEVMYIIGEHNHCLHYPLLKYVIDLYGSASLKEKIADYAKQVGNFRKETRLEVFSQVGPDEPEDINGRFTTMVSKHQMDWRTATLEDVEKFRIQVCRELSLYDFSLNLVKVARGCVEVTWRVPRSLVTYIQNSVKPSSQSMMEHHVTTLTIDGFIVYDSSFAMQLEYKVIRLGLQAIAINYGCLLEEMSPDEVVPHLVQRRLLTQPQGEEVWAKSSRLEKVHIIVEALREADDIVGMFPTFCMALANAGQLHVSERLRNKFQSLLKGEAVSHQQEEDEVMISGESSTQPSSPPPDSHLVTAQLEGPTLTRAQYNTIHSLTSSFLGIPTSDLVYDGHTPNPLTLHWHYYTICRSLISLSHCNAMAQEGIRKLVNGEKIIVLHLNETSLLSAAWDGDKESLDCALGAGVPVDCRISTGWSSLMYASDNGHVEVVERLLQHGATVDMQDKNGWSSLMVASQEGHVEVVDKLLQHGATVDLQAEVHTLYPQ